MCEHEQVGSMFVHSVTEHVQDDEYGNRTFGNW